MSAERLGEFAALATAVLWTGSYIAFTFAVRRLGADVVNRLRLAIALLLLVACHWLVTGTPIPLSADPTRWMWLALSGVVGFAVADAFLYRALDHLGAHRTSLVTALIPVVSTLLAWIVFGEVLEVGQILAALAVLAGIVLVLSARRADGRSTSRHLVRGVAFALVTVVAQSLRYILSMEGMRGGYPPLSTNVIQILAATIAAWAVAAPRGGWTRTLRALKDRRGAAETSAGAVVGPFLGVTLSLVALANAPVGVASTLMAMTPVLLLPASKWVFHERVTWRSLAGTALAAAGVAALFLL